jgi:hypothetical protein
MSESQQFHEQAAADHRRAAASTLPTIRSRYLESAAVWTELAQRAERTEFLRTLPLVSH